MCGRQSLRLRVVHHPTQATSARG
jgi:tripartite-type tricarboxylate transporter receptor subunit TctC